jgi:hypothetical protein
LHVHWHSPLAQVQMLLDEGVAPRDIGVIAPYNAQVDVFW